MLFLYIYSNSEWINCLCGWSTQKLKQKKNWQLPIFALRLSSAYECLTSLFGMGRGVPTQLSSPIKDFVL